MIINSLEINEPDGWKEAVLKLARDKEFYSLIEFFDGSFIFYGDNGVVNGGIHFIKALEETYGPDVSIQILIELAPDDVTFEEIFSGQLDLSLAEEMPMNKLRIPIIRDNFWAKFNSRWQTPVDLLAVDDLDGNPVASPVDQVSLTMPSQIITYLSLYNQLYSKTYEGVETYQLLNFDEVINDDIKLFSIVREAVDFDTFSLLGLFEAPYDGDFRIQIKFSSAQYSAAGPEWIGGNNTFRIKKTNESGVDTYGISNPVAGYTPGSSGTDAWRNWNLDVTYKLFRGEQLAISLHGSLATIFGKTQLFWKTNVDLATTGTTITLSGEQTIDDVLTSTSRVLVKDQGNTFDNGIYTTGAGAWTRVTDLDVGSEFFNAAVFVIGGTANTDSAWRQTEEVGTVGVDPNLWVFTDPSDERTRYWPGYDVQEVENYIRITASTRFRTSVNECFLIHDSAAAILKSYGLGIDNPFYSELLGSILTNSRTYDQDGCAWKYIVMKGLQVRGYTLTEKPFFMSFEQWWKGINPILCLGLTYEQTPASEIIVESTDVDLVQDWDDAGGAEPGTWNYIDWNYPVISINGNGGPSGYTCGLCPTVAGLTYEFTTLLQITPPNVNPLDLTVTWAILDAGFNVLDTQSFNYNSYEDKLENFMLTPVANGVYLAVKAVNDTAFDTKTILVRYAVSGSSEQILLNPDFDDASIWTNEGAGTDWAIVGGELTLSLAAGSSKDFTQDFIGTVAGTYLLLSERTLSNVDVGPDSLNLGLTLLDADGNSLGGTSNFGTANDTVPIWAEITTVVPAAKIKVSASINSGAGIDVSIPFIRLYSPTGIADIVVPELKVIRVEEREFFYDEDISVNISNIENIVRKYDNDKIYNKIEIGYSQWQSEDISGIDDPQTKSVYSTRFEKIGQGITVHSDFIAASLAIETTRRQTIEKSKDYKFDNNVFIIAINPDDISPDAYVPELDENFTSILNLLNSDTRYNIRLSVARNFLRWRKWFNGCLQQYLTSFFKFVGGEGNFDMITAMVDTSPDCLNEDYDGQSLSQKQDIEVTDEIIHTPNYYEIEVPMEWETYKTIRNNRRNAIGISLTEQNHKALFIDILDYELMNGKAKILGWTKEYFPLEVIEGPAATQDCLALVDECANAITDALMEILTDENGVCITE